MKVNWRQDSFFSRPKQIGGDCRQDFRVEASKGTDVEKEMTASKMKLKLKDENQSRRRLRRLQTWLTELVRKPMAFVCSSACCCNLRIDDTRNCRLNFSALTDGWRFRTAATSTEGSWPPLYLSTTSHTYSRSFATLNSVFGFCLFFLASLEITSARPSLSHSRRRRSCLAERNSSRV